ncbi:MAG: FAD-dependent monooxygenase [Microcystaceae cyanobacterium]
MSLDNIAIIGSGIGGLTLGCALSQRGIEYQLYEQADSFEALGYGIQVSPNVVRVLQELGLETPLKKISHLCQGFELRSFSSDQVLAQWKLNSPVPYYQCRRADLHQLLFDALPDQNKIRFSHHLSSFQSDGKSLTLNFAQQSSVTANALIAADGVRSKIRKTLFSNSQVKYAGYTAFRAILPFKDDYNYLLGKGVVWMGEDHHVVVYPNGSEKTWINVVLVLKNKTWNEEGWSILADKETVVKSFTNQSYLLNEILKDIIASPQPCLQWGLFIHEPLPYWSKGNITLLGDAAHPMLPFQAQGAAMAIEDAYILAGYIAQEKEIETAFMKYQKARLQRTAKVQQVSRKNADVFHASGLIAMARNNVFQMLSQFNPEFFNQRSAWIYDYDVKKVC